MQQSSEHLAAPSGDVPSALTVDAQSDNAPSAGGPVWEPEDCEVCGCEACDFGDEDTDGAGCWKCPECGATQ